MFGECWSANRPPIAPIPRLTGEPMLSDFILRQALSDQLMPRRSATEEQRRRPPEAHLDWGMKTPGGRFCFNSITSDAFAFSLTEFLVILRHPPPKSRSGIWNRRPGPYISLIPTFYMLRNIYETDTNETRVEQEDPEEEK